MAGGLQPIVKDGYELIYYPDVNNHELQRAGKPPVFYWLPNYVHIARKNGVEDGDLMFNLIRFAGIQSSESHVGVTTSDQREVAGGVLAFTATSAPPDRVLEESQNKIIEKFQGSSEFFWGIRTQQRPNFRPVIITSNITAVSNLSPDADGSVPMPQDSGEEGGGPSGGGPSGGGSGGGPSGGGPRAFAAKDYKKVAVPPMITKKGFSPKNFGKTRSNDGLDAWYWNMQGQGNGSIDPTGQNAYTALIGNYPTAMLWESFRGSYSPVFVQQALKIKFWVPQIEIIIRGKWERIFRHFSANAKGKSLWFSGDIQAEFNKMRISGGIEVDVKVDTTLPNADKITKYVNEKTNLVYEKFMEQAKKVIFEPPKPEVEAAEADTSGIWGAGFALKYRKDSTELELNYHEKRQMSYLQDHVISSSLEGLHDEIKDNPEAEEKYFQTIWMIGQESWAEL